MHWCLATAALHLCVSGWEALTWHLRGVHGAFAYQQVPSTRGAAAQMPGGTCAFICNHISSGC